ncbi:MAG: pyruvate kinase, partial [Nitrosomonas sp.]|nr:pyruvate kinase [Nitrosomonas sp.]
MIRRTKIVATLGPASCANPKILENMISAGVDVVRINFSHGTREQHLQHAEMTRLIAQSLGRTVGVLADLQGPKIRIGRFEQGRIKLNVGDKFILDSDCMLGNQERVGLDYKELPNDVETDATLMLDDGRIVLKVSTVSNNQIFCIVEQG